MAGPTAGVHVPRPLTDSDTTELRAMIASISSHQQGKDFWVADTTPIAGQYTGEGRPFLLGTSTPAEELGDDAEEHLTQIESAFGFRPVQEIGFIAMCNRPEDHRILGELCLWTAEWFACLIDFGGPLLPPLPKDMAARWFQGTLSWDEVHPLVEQMTSGMPGKLAETYYTTASGKTWATHHADAQFMRAWLNHPRFHMVK